MAILHTPRLILRRWHEQDLSPFAAMCADAEVMRWIRNGETRSRDECARIIASLESAWDEQGFGLFALERRDNGEFLGFAGLSIPDYLPEVLPAVEIGWRLPRQAWGQGYATEAAQAALQFANDQADIHRLVSICQIGNTASERIMQKIGLTLERETIDPTCGRPVRVYAQITP